MRLQKIKKLLKSKSLIGSILFAIALWGYTSFNNIYISVVDIPLEVKLPKSRALEEPLPHTISVEVRSKGWNLFDMYFFNTAARCYIDLSGTTIDTEYYRIPQNDMIKNLDYFKNVEPLDVYPEYLTLKTGAISKRLVAVESKIRIEPRDGFMLIGKVSIKPDSIFISGNEKVVGNINRWKTNYRLIEDVHSRFNFVIGLFDTLGTVINVLPKYVIVSANIQQIAEMVIGDVPVLITGGIEPKEHKIAPLYLDVTIRGGIDAIIGISPDVFSASIDYKKILSDTTGILKPEINAPSNVIVLRTDPPYIEHTRVRIVRTLAGLQ